MARSCGLQSYLRVQTHWGSRHTSVFCLTKLGPLVLSFKTFRACWKTFNHTISPCKVLSPRTAKSPCLCVKFCGTQVSALWITLCLRTLCQLSSSLGVCWAPQIALIPKEIWIPKSRNGAFSSLLYKGSLKPHIDWVLHNIDSMKQVQSCRR